MSRFDIASVVNMAAMGYLDRFTNANAGRENAPLFKVTLYHAPNLNKGEYRFLGMFETNEPYTLTEADIAAEQNYQLTGSRQLHVAIANRNSLPAIPTEQASVIETFAAIYGSVYAPEKARSQPLLIETEADHVNRYEVILFLYCHIQSLLKLELRETSDKTTSMLSDLLKGCEKALKSFAPNIRDDESSILSGGRFSSLPLIQKWASPLINTLNNECSVAADYLIELLDCTLDTYIEQKNHPHVALGVRYKPNNFASTCSIIRLKTEQNTASNKTVKQAKEEFKKYQVGIEGEALRKHPLMGLWPEATTTLLEELAKDYHPNDIARLFGLHINTVKRRLKNENIHWNLKLEEVVTENADSQLVANSKAKMFLKFEMVNDVMTAKTPIGIIYTATRSGLNWYINSNLPEEKEIACHSRVNKAFLMANEHYVKKIKKEAKRLQLI